MIPFLWRCWWINPLGTAGEIWIPLVCFGSKVSVVFLKAYSSRPVIKRPCGGRIRREMPFARCNGIKTIGLEHICQGCCVFG